MNSEIAKTSTLSTDKIDKYESYHLMNIPSNQSQPIEQAKFTYSSLGEVFEKQIKTIEDRERKQVEAVEVLRTTKQQK